jgi:apolipoprotein N-acyltransferase
MIERALPGRSAEGRSSRIAGFTRPAPRSWLWFLIGAALLPVAAGKTAIPVAAWLAPIFMLRFVRSTSRPGSAFLLVFAAYAVGIDIGVRGGPTDPFTWLVGALTMPLLRGLMYTLPYAADRLMGTRLTARARLMVLPVAFVTVDWIMSLFTWVGTFESPAYSQADALSLIQILSVTGMWGVTFLIMWCASTVNALWERDFDVRAVRGPVALFGGMLLAVVLFGSLRLRFAAPSAPTVEVATVTIDPAVYDTAVASIDWVRFNQSSDQARAAVRPKFEATVDQMLTRSETALRGGAKLVSWEEASAQVLAEDVPTVVDRASALARQYGAYLQIWLGVFTRSERRSLLGKDLPQPYYRNQSILINPAGQVLWIYDKSLVIPSEWIVNVRGNGQLPFADTPYGRLGTAICYEMDFPRLLRQAGRHGVDILLGPTNDVRPPTMARYRAVENGYSVVRAAGNGTTVIADYEGRVLGSQNYFTNSTGILMTGVPTHGVTTIYSRIGDAFAYLCVVALILLAGRALAREPQRAHIARPQPSATALTDAGAEEAGHPVAAGR